MTPHDLILLLDRIDYILDNGMTMTTGFQLSLNVKDAEA